MYLGTDPLPHLDHWPKTYFSTFCFIISISGPKQPKAGAFKKDFLEERFGLLLLQVTKRSKTCSDTLRSADISVAVSDVIVILCEKPSDLYVD